MFPLGTAILPSAAVPLHVFEPRYRQLVVDCLAADDDPPVFGSALIERGSEVGGGDQRAELGVVAEMHQIDAFQDGSYHFVAVGVSRLRILRWLDDDPYPRAEVETWHDPGLDRSRSRCPPRPRSPACRRGSRPGGTTRCPRADRRRAHQ